MFTVARMNEDPHFIVRLCTVQMKGPLCFFFFFEPRGLPEQQDPNSYVNHTNYLHTAPPIIKANEKIMGNAC